MMRWFLAFACLVLSGCNTGFSVDEKIGSSHRLIGVDSGNQTELMRIDSSDSDSYSGQTILGPTISRAGWDKDWLIMEQRAQDSNRQMSKDRRFYLFRLHDNKLFGPYKNEQFQRQRANLGVTKKLNFSRYYVND